MIIRVLSLLSVSSIFAISVAGADQIFDSNQTAVSPPATNTRISAPATSPLRSQISQPATAAPSGTVPPIPGTVTKIARPGEIVPTAEQLKKWNAPIKGFHPIKRLTRPIWKLRREALELQDNIVALQSPMNGLQPAFTSMEKRMASVESKFDLVGVQLFDLNGKLTQLSGDLSRVNQLSPIITGVGTDIKKFILVRDDIHNMSTEMKQVERPLNRLEAPMLAVLKPLASVENQVALVQTKMLNVQNEIELMQKEVHELSKLTKELQTPLTNVTQPLTDVRNQLIGLNKLLIAIVFVTCASALAALAGAVVGLTLLYRFRHSVVAFVTRHNTNMRTTAEHLAPHSAIKAEKPPPS